MRIKTKKLMNAFGKKENKTGIYKGEARRKQQKNKK